MSDTARAPRATPKGRVAMTPRQQHSARQRDLMARQGIEQTSPHATKLIVASAPRRNRHRPRLLAVSITPSPGGSVKDPAYALAGYMWKALRRPAPAPVIITDATGQEIARYDPVTRTRTASRPTP